MSDPTLRDIDTQMAFTIFADLTCKYALELFEEEVALTVKKAWNKVKVYGSDPAGDEAVKPKASQPQI
jgi:hypothetical protein